MKIALVILGVFVVLALPLAFLVFHGMAEIKALVIHEVDLSKIADGTYSGSYHKGRWTYDVEVVVRDHRIVSLHNMNPRMNVQQDWNDKAAALILEKQAISIDVISGATVNTRAFEKAVEVALSSPRAP
ncbi:MAG TPA: FMN-binding protein [Polyangiales bacterium]|nr:FMN-binding protein [Polyangiales bacterium]